MSCIQTAATPRMAANIHIQTKRKTCVLVRPRFQHEDRRLSSTPLMQEVAWASFALLKNINIDGLLVFAGSKLLMGRGEFAADAKLEDIFQRQVSALS